MSETWLRLPKVAHNVLIHVAHIVGLSVGIEKAHLEQHPLAPPSSPKILVRLSYQGRFANISCKNIKKCDVAGDFLQFYLLYSKKSVILSPKWWLFGHLLENI